MSSLSLLSTVENHENGDQTRWMKAYSSTSTIPPAESIFFPESSYFKENPEDTSLPSPDEVRKEASFLDPSQRGSSMRRTPIIFPSKNLLVKYGHTISMAEGQCLWLLRDTLHGQVPVPEVYGWCRDGREVFIYMQLIKGQTLESRWEQLNPNEKVSVCQQLRQMVTALRTLTKHPRDHFIGNVVQGPLADIMFVHHGATDSGPFPSVKTFHDWYSQLPYRHHPKTNEPHLLRSILPDDSPVFFTHGDLHRSNIIVSAAGDDPPRILAIIDWHQSGWYPAYWEFCKASYSVPVGSDWLEYLPPIFCPYDDYNIAWEFISMSII